MIQLLSAAKEIFDCLEAQKLEGCLIGGLAVQRWGQPRLTHDVDLTVLAEPGCETKIADLLFQRLAARIEGAREFALQYRVVLLRASNGVDVDVALGATSFEIESVHRATPFEFEVGCILRTCSAEDLIVHKIIAGRPQDVADIRGIVNRQVGRLDLRRTREWLKIFAEVKGEPNLGRPFEEALLYADTLAERNRKSRKLSS